MSTPDLSSEADSWRRDAIVVRTCACGCGCILSDRQKRFASGLCRSAWWDQQHPRVNRGPAGPRAGTIKALILGLMADGEWRTYQQAADAIHASEHSVGARVSELRRAGHQIEVDARNGDSRRFHRFRLMGSR